MEQIHDDIVEYVGSEERPALVVEKTECAFVATDSTNKSLYIDNIKLDHIPHIGEIVYFEILRPYFGSMSLFKVNDIAHEISCDRHKITIYLRQNVNMYAKWLEEKNEYDGIRSVMMMMQYIAIKAIRSKRGCGVSLCKKQLLSREILKLNVYLIHFQLLLLFLNKFCSKSKIIFN